MDIGLILAGGRSTRFGPTDKLLAPLAGRPLVTYAASALGQVALDHRLIVTGSKAVAQAVPEIEPVFIDARETGQSDTLHAGVAMAQSLGATRLLVVLGDMPCVTGAHLTAVLGATRPDQAAASLDGTGPMPPAAFPAALFAPLLATRGDKGAAPLLRALPPEALIPAPASQLFDVDTQAALAEIEALLSHSRI